MMPWSNQPVVTPLVLIIGSGPNTGLFVYSGTPTPGNLIASIAAGGGTDASGNQYLPGVCSYTLIGGTFFLIQMDSGVVGYYTSSPDMGPWTLDVQTQYNAGTGFLELGAPGAPGLSVGDGVTGRVVATGLSVRPTTLSPLGTGVVSNSAAETVIGTFTTAFPAGDEAVNSGYRFRVAGSADAAATSPTLTLRVRLDTVGGTVVFAHTAIAYLAAGGTSRPYTLDAFVYVTATGASGSMQGACHLSESWSQTGPSATQDVQSGAVVIDTTVNHDLVVTAQWSAASTSNRARTSGGSLERICH